MFIFFHWINFMEREILAFTPLLLISAAMLLRYWIFEIMGKEIISLTYCEFLVNIECDAKKKMWNDINQHSSIELSLWDVHKNKLVQSDSQTNDYFNELVLCLPLELIFRGIVIFCFLTRHITQASQIWHDPVATSGSDNLVHELCNILMIHALH